jgi:pyroglutamyl-peptidase
LDLLICFCFQYTGVHGEANKIKLEKCSMNGFPLPDVTGRCLNNQVVCLKNSGKCRGLETQLNVAEISRNLNASHNDMFETSCDVGRFLCAYIYLKSLDIDSSRSLFVHVPCINKPYSTEETAVAIFKVIEQCVIDLTIGLSLS